ncbi:MAG: hypothetical protein GWP06_09910, partial [Actinobacteria bacterium]|nr:hypothetical protein [Actinomycetota bacterium]
RMRLYEPHIAQNTHAGQFVNIQIPKEAAVFWRRPFSIHGASPQSGIFEILFNAVGRGTRVLREIKTGAKLNLVGPLGNTFNHPEDVQEIIIVAGGLGIAPFKLMLQDLSNRQLKKTVFFGVSSKAALCCLDEFRRLGAEYHISTEDGSQGYHGFVTDDLQNYLIKSPDLSHRQLLVCGPTPMLRKVQKLAQTFQLDAQVSVENRMACGFGACMGCPVRLAHPLDDDKQFLLACKDGPVFNMDEILLDD